jgi:hypothetical protein
MFGVVWLAAVVVSVPAGFVFAYTIAGAKFDVGPKRVILATLFGFILAPLFFFGAYFLPFTVWIVIAIVVVGLIARRQRSGGQATI